MAHEIGTTDNMMYTGAVPWHGIGKLIPEHCTPSEALDHAGLRWEVLQAIPTWNDGGFPDDLPQGSTAKPQGTQALENHRVLYRSDTREALGVVSKDYKPFQNAELATFIGEVLGDDFAAVETAGSFGGGRRVWFLLEQGRHDIAGVDPIGKYTFVATGHDGKLAIRFIPTNIRVVCANTFRMAGGENHSTGLSISHRGNVKESIEKARHVLAGTESIHDAFIESANRLAFQDVESEQWLSAYFKRAYIQTIASKDAQSILLNGNDMHLATPEDRKRFDRAATKMARTVSEWTYNFHDADGGQTDPRVRNSRWNAFNSITRWMDHDSPSRGDRHESNIIGKRSEQKADILNLTLSLD